MHSCCAININPRFNRNLIRNIQTRPIPAIHIIIHPVKLQSIPEFTGSCPSRTPKIVPLFGCPDLSAAVVPLPSEKCQLPAKAVSFREYTIQIHPH